MTAKPLAELVHPSWAAALTPVEEQLTALGAFLRDEVAAGRGYLPAGRHILRAFTQPLDAVRVLVVGQDPYPTPGHPIGLSFAVDVQVAPIPRSLANIYRELVADLCSLTASLPCAPAPRRVTGARAGRRSPRAPSPRWPPAADPSLRSFGAGTHATSDRSCAAYPLWSRRILHRCPPTQASLARGPSVGPTTSSPSKIAHPSIGVSRDTAHLEELCRRRGFVH